MRFQLRKTTRSIESDPPRLRRNLRFIQLSFRAHKIGGWVKLFMHTALIPPDWRDRPSLDVEWYVFPEGLQPGMTPTFTLRLCEPAQEVDICGPLCTERQIRIQRTRTALNIRTSARCCVVTLEQSWTRLAPYLSSSSPPGV